MTREEYLKALKNEIMALSVEEQAEALQYYSDYFEEAGDDQRIMEELGSPEELAKTITEKFANAIVKTSSGESKDEDDSSENLTDNKSVFYSFKKDSVKNLDLSFGAAEIVLIRGDKYSVETRGLGADDIECTLKSNGTLDIHNIKKLCFDFFSHNRTSRIVPRILLTVPANVKLNRFTLSIGAGNFHGKDLNFSCQKGKIEVGAGNLVIGKVYGGQIDFRCGMGNLEFSGAVSGLSNIDCGMGSIKILIGDKLPDNSSDYSYDLKLGLGDFKFNTAKHSGIYQNLNTARKSNHFSVNCGMGSVNIKVK